MLSGFLDTLLYFSLEGRRISIVGTKEVAGDIVKSVPFPLPILH